jgi:bifunctional non-homologous end joining protein LigD
MSVLQSANLYYKEGASDKVYYATIEDLGGNYVVNFAYGRRGNALKTGSKTNSPTTLVEAKKIFESLVKEKTGKGYQYIDNSSKQDESIPVVSDDLPETPSEIQCVLLNPINENELESYIQDDKWVAQEKLDGVRFMLKKGSSSPTGFNRKGKRISIPTDIWNNINKYKKDFFIDGELIGDNFYVFDILEHDGKCIRENKFVDRHQILKDVVKELGCNNIILVDIHKSSDDKRKLYENLLSENKEGVVFKKLDAHYYIGRPASGGNYVKHKFYSTCSCVVTAINKKRSAALGLYKGKKLVKAGNVTISSNFDLPEVDTVVEVRYLYARKQSGALYQPVYLGERTDIFPKECVQTQLKFKKEEENENF